MVLQLQSAFKFSIQDMKDIFLPSIKTIKLTSWIRENIHMAVPIVSSWRWRLSNRDELGSLDKARQDCHKDRGHYMHPAYPLSAKAPRLPIATQNPRQIRQTVTTAQVFQVPQ